jgi:hypothetical protein
MGTKREPMPRPKVSEGTEDREREKTNLDGGGVVRLAHFRGVRHAAVPDVDDVVVSARSEELSKKWE